MSKAGTHVVQPGEFPGGRVGAHVALEVDVVALLDVAGRQRAAQPQPHHRRVCNQQQPYVCRIEQILELVWGFLLELTTR